MTQGCITATDGRFNCICQVASMCPPIRAHWRHLVNMTELVLPSARSSPQPKLQIDRFSHFCTAHGRMSSGMPRHVLSPNNCPFAWVTWTLCNTCFVGPTRVHNPNAISINSAALHSTVHVRVSSGMPFLLKIAPSYGGCIPHLTQGSLG